MMPIEDTDVTSSRAAPQPTRVSDGAEALRVYRTQEVVQILGISRRQLQYWAQTDLVTPSGKTPGGHYRYTFGDLISLKATKRLIDAGISVQSIRSSIGALRRMLPRIERPLSQLTLVATGDVVLVLHDGSAFEAISGQEWVFEVAKFETELAAWRDGTRDVETLPPRAVSTRVNEVGA
jgi:DNA-binding transcriptional MerR regulator